MVMVQVLFAAIRLSVAQVPGLDPESQPFWSSFVHDREVEAPEPQSPLQAAM
jgi:hypothetical protein